MGREEMAAAAPGRAERTAPRICADSEDPWGALCPGQCLSVHIVCFDDFIAESAPAQPKFCLALSYYGRVSRALGGRSVTHCASVPAIPLLHVIAAFARFVGRDYGEAIRLSRPTLCDSGRILLAHRVLTAAAGMSGLTTLLRLPFKNCASAAARHIGLDRDPHGPTAPRSRTLSGRF